MVERCFTEEQEWRIASYDSEDEDDELAPLLLSDAEEALREAVKRNDIETVRRLFSTKDDENGRRVSFKKLEKHDDSCLTPASLGWTVLNIAAALGLVEMLSVLVVECGASIHSNHRQARVVLGDDLWDAPRFTESALESAAHFGHLDAVRLLLRLDDEEQPTKKKKKKQHGG